MPPSWRNFSSTGVSPRRSRMTSSRPGTMKEVCRARLEQVLEDERRVLGEDLPVGPEPDVGARAVLGDPAALAGQPGLRGEGRRRPLAGEDAGDAALEGHPLAGRGPVHVDVEARGDGVDHGRADAVEAAGGDVGAAAELPARVELGVDDLEAGEAGLRLLVDRDAATVVVDLGRVVGVQRHLDAGGGSGERLVDAVVDDLPQAVHEAPGVGRAEVHPGALAHRLEPLQDQEVGCVVGVVGDGAAPACRGPAGSVSKSTRGHPQDRAGGAAGRRAAASRSAV